MRMPGAPVPSGRLNAEPGGGRASGAAQRCRHDVAEAMRLFDVINGERLETLSTPWR
jgi:hypothetical protein